MKKICMSFLVFSLIIIANSHTLFVSEEEYTYTVRLYAGSQGTITSGGVTAHSKSAGVSSKGDCVEISGLKYGDMVYIRSQDAAKVTDERYYVRGVRRSGRDNAEAESPAFYVACDRDYVVAYGVKGDMASYTVNYQDESGNILTKSDTYYGNIGERQYVSSRYIEGYQPKSLNMVKTLSYNAVKNVSLPDNEIPLDQQNLEDLDDGEVPMTDVKLEQGTVMGYMPVYIGIGVAAVAALAVAAVYLRKRQRKMAVKAVGKEKGRVTGSK